MAATSSLTVYIRRTLERLEVERNAYAKEVNRYNVQLWWITTVCAVVFAVVVVVFGLYQSAFLLLLALGLFFGVPLVFLRPYFDRPNVSEAAIRAFEQRLSTEIYTAIAQKLGEGVVCQLEKPISKEHITPTFLGKHLTSPKSRYWGKNYCCGKTPAGQRFHFSELNVQEWLPKNPSSQEVQQSF